MKLYKLEDGVLLRKRLLQYSSNSTQENLDSIFSLLKDQSVFIPCKPDEKLEEDIEVTLSAITVTTNDLEYLPAFSNQEQALSKFDEDTILMETHFQDAIYMARENGTLEGIVIDPFTISFKMDMYVFDKILSMDGEIDDDEYLDPRTEALLMGDNAYYDLDYMAAQEFYYKASCLNVPEAMRKLGDMYIDGVLGEVDIEKGEYYLDQADCFDVDDSYNLLS